MEMIVLIVLYLAVTGAEASHLEGPQNTLSVVGSNVTLKCLSPSRNCSGIDWLIYIAGNSKSIFKYSGIMASAYSDRYSMENVSGCHLVIKNVELTDAGRYLCRTVVSSNTVEKSADLIILATEPKCATNVSSGDIVEGDGVWLTCEVDYNGTNRASMAWNGEADAPRAVENGITMSRTYSVVASAPEVPSFTCNFSVAAETKDNGEPIKGSASNIPATICETPAIKILYSVRNVSLSPSLTVYSPGTIITCTAEGNPAPSFKWQMMEPKINATWQDIPHRVHHQFAQFSDASQYRCVATNVVKGETHTATSTVFQILQSGELNSTTTSTTPSNSEDRVGGGVTGMGFGVGFLVAILLASITFVIFVRLRLIEFHLRPANKPEESIDREIDIQDGVVQPMEHQIIPSSRQLSVMYASIPETEAPLASEQESAYASLREDRDVNEYASLEEKRKTMLERKSSNLSLRSTTHDVQSA